MRFDLLISTDTLVSKFGKLGTKPGKPKRNGETADEAEIGSEIFGGICWCHQPAVHNAKVLCEGYVQKKTVPDPDNKRRWSFDALLFDEPPCVAALRDVHLACFGTTFANTWIR